MPYVVHEHSQYTSRVDKFWYFINLEKAHAFYAKMLAYRDKEFPESERKEYCRTHFEEEGEDWEFLELEKISFEDEDEDEEKKDRTDSADYVMVDFEEGKSEDSTSDNEKSSMSSNNKKVQDPEKISHSTSGVEEDCIKDADNGTSSSTTTSAHLFRTFHNPRPKQSMSTSRSAKAGLLFPVSRVGRYLSRGKYAERIGGGAPVYLAAVMEYISAEILELAGTEAHGANKSRIVPKHIQLAVMNDSELNRLFGNTKIEVKDAESDDDGEGDVEPDNDEQDSEDERELIQIMNDREENAYKEDVHSLPVKVKCPRHALHELTRMESDRFRCDVYGCSGDEYSYCCVECNFDTHLKCANTGENSIPGTVDYSDLLQDSNVGSLHIAEHPTSNECDIKR